MSYKQVRFFFISMLLVQCGRTTSFEFQEFEPKSGVRLSAMLDQTPLLRSAFGNVDAGTFNRKLAEWFHSDPATAALFLSHMGVLARQTPGLPKLFNSLGGHINQLTAHYQDKTDEFDHNLQLIKQLMNSKAIAPLLKEVSKLVEFSANRTYLFSASPAPVFPAQNVWGDCAASLQQGIDFGATRNAFFSVYETLQIPYCAYQESDLSIHALLKHVKNSGQDPEVTVGKLLNYLSNNLDDLKLTEEELISWFVAKPGDPYHAGKKFLLEYLVNAVIHISGSNGMATKLQDEISPFTNQLYAGGTSTFANAQTTFLSTGSGKLADILWNGTSFTGLGENNTKNFSGIASTYMPELNAITSASTETVPFRQHIQNLMNGLVPVPQTYAGESATGAVVHNLYFHVLESFYNPSQQKWAITENDGLNYLGDRSKNLSGFMGSVQNNLLNLFLLNREGKVLPETPNPDINMQSFQIPFISSLLYTIATSNGLIDNRAAQSGLIYKEGLKNAGSGDVYKNGIRIVDISLLWGLLTPEVARIRVMCPGNVGEDDGGGTSKDCSELAGSVQRKTASNTVHPFVPALETPLYELLTPGRFKERTASAAGGATGPLVGDVSSHQGDVDSTRHTFTYKPNTWMSAAQLEGPASSKFSMSQIALTDWEGHGPYTYKGKAPNGSLPKYENDFYTDGYKTHITFCKRYSDDFWRTNTCVEYENKPNGLGANKGVNTHNFQTEFGRYHMYENIYRPMKPTDNCWVQSEGAIHGYAKFAFLRPSNSNAHHNTANCASWTKIQVDMNSREDAILENHRWLMDYKKFIFILPNYGKMTKERLLADSCSGANCPGSVCTWYVSFPEWLGGGGQCMAWSTVYFYPTDGASFSSYTSLVFNGLSGPTRGAKACPEITCNGRWKSDPNNNMMGADGDTGLLDQATGMIPNSSGDGGYGFVNEPPPANFPDDRITRFGRTSYAPGDSMSVSDFTVETWGLSDAGPAKNRLYGISWNSSGMTSSMPPLVIDNFDVLYNLAQKYQAEDLLGNCAGTSCTNGEKQTPQTVKFSKFYHTYFPDISLASTKPSALPPVPKVAGVSYPGSFDANGQPQDWYTYQGISEGKFGKIAAALIMLYGTMHEHESFRPAFSVVDELSSSLNSAHYVGNMLYPAYKNLPGYTKSFINLLTEESPGARNGFIVKLLRNPHFFLGNMEDMKNQSSDISALQELFTTLLYNRNSNTNSHLVLTLAENVQPMLAQTKGSYGTLLDFALEGSKPDAFLDYFTANVKIPGEYRTFDLLKEITVLANTPAMREFESQESFWWQYGELVSIISKRVSQNLSNPAYYQNLRSIFGK